MTEENQIPVNKNWCDDHTMSTRPPGEAGQAFSQAHRRSAQKLCRQIGRWREPQHPPAIVSLRLQLHLRQTLKTPLEILQHSQQCSLDVVWCMYGLFGSIKVGRNLYELMCVLDQFINNSNNKFNNSTILFIELKSIKALASLSNECNVNYLF